MGTTIFGDSIIIRDKKTSKRVINTLQSAKWPIECEPGRYKVGNITGSFSNDMDCIIQKWHFRDKIIVNSGEIILTPGTGRFIIQDNMFENS